MDDPIFTKKFISDIIVERKDDIVGLAVPVGDRLTLRKGKSKYAYIISLMLIMGPINFFKYSLTTILFQLKKLLYRKNILNDDPSIISFARFHGINAFRISSPNNNKFLNLLEKIKPDIIINQSQSILKSKLLSIPKIGVLNRHNALLPKNRGRLTPFWVIFHNEKSTGVSIHFVEEGIDSGDIVIQKEYLVEKNDTFNSIVKKNYEIASKAMLEALNVIESNKYKVNINDDKLATYNSTPTILDAIKYRIKIIKRYL